MEFRKLKAEFDLLSVILPPQNGIETRCEIIISDDHEKATIHVWVVSDLLPKNFDMRKKRLEEIVGHAIGVTSLEFGVVGRDTYSVKFFDSNLITKEINNIPEKGGKRIPPDVGMVAEYSNGKLTMH